MPKKTLKQELDEFISLLREKDTLTEETVGFRSLVNEFKYFVAKQNELDKETKKDLAVALRLLIQKTGRLKSQNIDESIARHYIEEPLRELNELYRQLPVAERKIKEKYIRKETAHGTILIKRK